MRMHNGNFPQWMEWLSYLVSTMATDELAMCGKRASATTELALFSVLIYSNPSNKRRFLVGGFGRQPLYDEMGAAARNIYCYTVIGFW